MARRVACRRAIAFPACLGLIVMGCGGARPEIEAPRDRTAWPEPTGSSEGPVVPPPSAGLRRTEVRRILDGGLGAFLQRVELSGQPALRNGRFYGFRIAGLQGDPSFWRGVDLRPGDVVTRVNGFAIEHPEEMLRAFDSLAVASELRVDYERAGVERVLRYPILDE
jgi:hypothetical protein